MKFIFISFFIICISFQAFCQKKDYDFWHKKMKNSIYLKEISMEGEKSRNKIANGYYGSDLQLLKKLDIHCYRSEADLIRCLKSVGFKKAEDFSKDIFIKIDLFSLFIKQNPDFYKLEIDLRKKLLKEFAIDNFSPQLPI